MRGLHLLEGMVINLAAKMEPRVSLAAKRSNEQLGQWIKFHGLKGADVHIIVARQAALNLLLKALICQIVAPGTLPNPAPAKEILAIADDVYQRSGRGHLPASYLDSLALETGASVEMPALMHLLTILQKESQDDVIGAVYAALIPQDSRRTLGQFWTPVHIAELMTHWAIQKPNDRVLDPAFGSGVFLLAAIKRLLALGQSGPTAAQQVAGVELSPVAFEMGVANVLLRYREARPTLRLGDFLVPLRAPMSILKEPSVTYEIEAFQPTLPGLEPSAPTAFPGLFDAIICNPPYTRHHHLPEAYKATWIRGVEQQFGLRLSRFSSLFAYFFVQAARQLAPSGRMAFITPAVVFEASYSHQVKAFIQRQLRLRAIISFDEVLSVFEGVDTAATITLLEGPQAPRHDQVTFVRVSQWPGTQALLDALASDSAATLPWGSVHHIALADLHPRRKWTVIAREAGRFADDRFVPLGQLARVMRGIATGANDFFVLSDAEVEAWGLSPSNLRPVLTKTREAPGYIFDRKDFERLGREGKKRWLLYLSGPLEADTPEARYIRHGEQLGLHRRSLVRKRPRWYEMERRAPPPILFTYLSRKKSRFIYNHAGVLALNVFLYIYPDRRIVEDETALKALLAILNSLVSKDALRRVGRTYGGDTIKLEPREMDRLPVLNPLALEEADRNHLASLFDSLCAAKSDGVREEIRQAIDEAIVGACIG